MWIVTTVPPLAAALAAAALAWHHATRLDQRSAGAWSGELRDKQKSRIVVLGALVTAVAAALILQLVLLSRLGSAG